jgi:hypothetical protein
LIRIECGNDGDDPQAHHHPAACFQGCSVVTHSTQPHTSTKHTTTAVPSTIMFLMLLNAI